MESAISIRNLEKSFEFGKNVLNNISLDIPTGSIFTIIGFSGTGKSVLFKHILGIMKPTRGEIIVLGESLSGMTYAELVRFRRRFGVLFQGSALFDDLTVLENVCFPLVEHRKSLSKSQVIEIARDRLYKVGISEEHFYKLPSEISGGMQKRTGLARALSLDPDILFYDEPTTGLDPVLTEVVDELILKSHYLKENRTTVMISHDLVAAFRLSSLIAMLDQGKVICSGDKETFLNSDHELVKKFVQKGLFKKG